MAVIVLLLVRGPENIFERREREREQNLSAKYITKQKINSKNSTVAGHQKRH